MSSSNRLSKSSLKFIEKKILYSGDKILDEDMFKKTETQHMIEESKKRIQEEEEKMLKEVEKQKVYLIQKAYEEGKEKAREEAKIEVKKEIEELMNKTKAIHEEANKRKMEIINEAEDKLKNYLNENKEQILNLSILMASKIIEKEIETTPDTLNEMYQKAIFEIKYETKKIYIRMNQKTQNLLFEHTDIKENKRFEILIDPLLELGDLIVETDLEFLDHQTKTKLKQIKDKIRGVLYEQL